MLDALIDLTLKGLGQSIPATLFTFLIAAATGLNFLLCASGLLAGFTLLWYIDAKWKQERLNFKIDLMYEDFIALCTGVPAPKISNMLEMINKQIIKIQGVEEQLKFITNMIKEIAQANFFSRADIRFTCAYKIATIGRAMETETAMMFEEMPEKKRKKFVKQYEKKIKNKLTMVRSLQKKIREPSGIRKTYPPL